MSENEERAVPVQPPQVRVRQDTRLDNLITQSQAGQVRFGALSLVRPSTPPCRTAPVGHVGSVASAGEGLKQSGQILPRLQVERGGKDCPCIHRRRISLSGRAGHPSAGRKARKPWGITSMRRGETRHNRAEIVGRALRRAEHTLHAAPHTPFEDPVGPRPYGRSVLRKSSNIMSGKVTTIGQGAITGANICKQWHRSARHRVSAAERRT